MTPDALVSELRVSARVEASVRSDLVENMLEWKAADSLTHLQSEVERLTRERDEFEKSWHETAEQAKSLFDQTLELKAERDAARAELAAARNTALEEAAASCQTLLSAMPGEGSWGDYDAGLAAAYERCADNITALKTEA